MRERERQPKIKQWKYEKSAECIKENDTRNSFTRFVHLAQIANMRETDFCLQLLLLVLVHRFDLKIMFPEPVHMN